MALLANIHRNTKARPKPFKPGDFLASQAEPDESSAPSIPSPMALAVAIGAKTKAHE